MLAKMFILFSSSPSYTRIYSIKKWQPNVKKMIGASIINGTPKMIYSVSYSKTVMALMDFVLLLSSPNDHLMQNMEGSHEPIK